MTEEPKEEREISLNEEKDGLHGARALSQVGICLKDKSRPFHAKICISSTSCQMYLPPKVLGRGRLEDFLKLRNCSTFQFQYYKCPHI